MPTSENDVEAASENGELKFISWNAKFLHCSLNYAKRSFFGAFHGLFGKLLNLASETVILE